MPPYDWQVEPIELIRGFEIQLQNPVAGALIAWAVWAVDCLHYLDDLDREYDVAHLSIGDHRPDVIDVANARWATSTCITALYLCAAALGRAFCNNTGGREYDLAYFDPAKKTSRLPQVRARREQLPMELQKWLDEVLTDPDYELIKIARDSLTHSRLTRHFYLGAADPPQRLDLKMSIGKMPVRQIIERSRNLATDHVSRFLQSLGQL